MTLSHTCRNCGPLPTDHFYKRTHRGVVGFQALCKACNLADSKRRKTAQGPQERMWRAARQRASETGVPFSIRIEDIVLPERCPVLGLVLRNNPAKCGPDSYSLDRIIPELGYVPGNIQVISHKANTIKNAASLAELERVAVHLRATLTRSQPLP